LIPLPWRGRGRGEGCKERRNSERESLSPVDTRPLITLTTDFGLGDTFVGIMKGVILGICPEARLVDLTHEVPRHDVLAAQLALEAAASYFPRGCIHLAVVDPGVGTARRPLCLRAGDTYYVGPDNGLFTFALDRPWTAVRLEDPAFRLAAVSRTFHGRDVFAPAAAHLAAGIPIERLGAPIGDPVRLSVPMARLEEGDLVGEVIGVDRFGNLTTSVTERDLERLGFVGEVEVGGRAVAGLSEAYGAVGQGVAGAILGSQGRLEIFVREGSARVVLGLGTGAPVRVRARR
jgi:S-adenosylmethionine hydrolase